jgi:ABC-type polysaccharide/polyol phosphate export permease
VLALLAFLFTTGACVFVSCANLFFRDVKYLVQVFLTFGIFFTPIFFEPAMLGETGGRLLMLNPLSPVLEGLRLCVTQGHDLAHTLRAVDAQGLSVVVWTPWYLAYAAAVAVLGFVGSALLFRRVEHVFAEYV